MATNHYLPGRLGIVGATAASTAGWLLAVASLFGVVSFLPDLGWIQIVSLVVLCGAPQYTLWATRRLRASRQFRATVPRSLLEQRLHGNLDAMPDGDDRPLRSIGVTASEIAARTGSILARLIDNPSVRIFHGVSGGDPTGPVVAHAVTAGRTLILVESVTWPSGYYQMDDEGRVRCDGRSIGQSAGELIAAVHHWRRVLPRGHRVSGLVVVHATGDGDYTLPRGSSAGLAWVGSAEVLDSIGQRLPRRRTVNAHTFAALAAATRPGRDETPRSP